MIQQPPFLSAAEFGRACTRIAAACHAGGWDGVDVAAVDRDAAGCLRIKRLLMPTLQHSAASWARDSDGEVEGEEPDEAAIQRSGSVRDTATVEYDILLSPSYQVPVLYFHLHRLLPGGPQGIDAVYRFLVPKQTERELRSVGVLGGITMTNHPITDVPCYFMHPCNTAKAMEHVIGTRRVSETQYLLIWIGLVGAAVGLDLPKELAWLAMHEN